MKYIKGIYMIKNKVDNKVYIGLSKNIKRRFTMHKTNLNSGKHKNDYLQKAWNKYGCDSFEFIILEEINNEDINISDREIYYIQKYNSANRDYGYNLTYGGESCNMTDEAKLNMRCKGISLTEEDVRKIKLLIVSLMDRGEIAKIFNVSMSVIKQIANLKNFIYIHEDLNYLVKNIKRIMINERNELILKVYSECLSIKKTSDILELSDSIVEKCVYKYTNAVQDNIEKRKIIYNKVMSLYDEGLKPYQISKILGVENTTIVGYVSGKSNPYNELSYKKIKNEDKIEIIRLYFEESLTAKKIGEIFGVSKNTIESVINNYKYANTEVN
ncbi:GIY-YIG nuclease family protein [Clostridium sp.]|uniref:GIY-YIG nuclease family protein n=1 Tax=Clostridium sp. TaxID=1506 RepID=UPI003F352D7C